MKANKISIMEKMRKIDRMEIMDRMSRLDRITITTMPTIITHCLTVYSSSNPINLNKT
jgi:hypothetical protein